MIRTFDHFHRPTDRTADRLCQLRDEANAEGLHAAVVEYWHPGQEDEEFGSVAYIVTDTEDELVGAINTIDGQAAEFHTL